MTHSLSTFDADRPPAMYRSATLAMVVSSTSMNVGMTTAMATNQGLIAGRLRALGAMVTLLTWGLFRQEEPRRRNLSREARRQARGGGGLALAWGVSPRRTGAFGKRGDRL